MAISFFGPEKYFEKLKIIFPSYPVLSHAISTSLPVFIFSSLNGLIIDRDWLASELKKKKKITIDMENFEMANLKQHYTISQKVK